jgi:hypothetical protein
VLCKELLMISKVEVKFIICYAPNKSVTVRLKTLSNAAMFVLDAGHQR